MIMTHIYDKPNTNVAHKAKRRASVAEINLLRKFEDKQMIEDRINRQLGKLHRLWFKGIPR
jgi:hypothetical protein